MKHDSETYHQHRQLYANASGDKAMEEAEKKEIERIRHSKAIEHYDRLAAATEKSIILVGVGIGLLFGLIPWGIGIWTIWKRIF